MPKLSSKFLCCLLNFRSRVYNLFTQTPISLRVTFPLTAKTSQKVAMRGANRIPHSDRASDISSENRIPLIDPYTPAGNGGLDNENGDLIVYRNSRIVDSHGATYVVKKRLGSGQFGQVYKVILETHGNQPRSFALKISRSSTDAQGQFEYETQALEYLRAYLSQEDRAHISELDSSFVFSNHCCIVLELLGKSCLTELSDRRFVGFPLPVIQNVLRCVLPALHGLSKIGLMHCDVKPENIVRVCGSETEFKLIDFGSCMFQGDSQIEYFQSRYYRAPEVVLRLSFDSKVDVWSLGCVAAELMLGLPLLPAHSELHLVSLMRQTIGPFPRTMSEMSPRNAVLFMPDGEVKSPSLLCEENNEDFDTTFEPYFVMTELRDIIRSYECTGQGSDTMENREVFLDMLEKMLTIDPNERISAEDALSHPFMSLEFPNSYA